MYGLEEMDVADLRCLIEQELDTILSFAELVEIDALQNDRPTRHTVKAAVRYELKEEKEALIQLIAELHRRT